MIKYKNVILLLEQVVNSLLYFILPFAIMERFSVEVGANYYIASNLALYVIIGCRVFFFQTLSYYGSKKISCYLHNLNVLVNYSGVFYIVMFIYLGICFHNGWTVPEVGILIFVIIMSDIERINLLARSQYFVCLFPALISIILVLLFHTQQLDTAKYSGIVIIVLFPYYSLLFYRFIISLRKFNIVPQKIPFRFSAVSLYNNLLQVTNASLTIWMLGIFHGSLTIASYGALKQCGRLFSPFQQYLNIVYMKKFSLVNDKDNFDYLQHCLKILISSLAFFSILILTAPYLISLDSISIILLFIVSVEAAILLSTARLSKFIQSKKINSHTLQGAVIFTITYWMLITFLSNTLEILTLIFISSLTGRFCQAFFVVWFYQRIGAK